jgi:phosphatidylserine/phosphatidylglycerophosphate/cardiolipin synthase-like enzyme
LTEEQEIRRNNLPIPDYVASRGARLEGILGRVSDAPLRDGNRLALLKNGPDTYEDWLAAIAGAERWIHLDNYIFQDDEIGNKFAGALSSKAKEGVRVRVLHDWFGCLDVARSFWKGMREAGVQVKAVNPPPLVRRWEPFAATIASCSSWTASTPPREACASPTAGWSAPR